MTTKEVKEYLKQYRDAVRRATAAQDHLEELQSMATRVTPNYGGEGGGTHQSSDEKMMSSVFRIRDAEARVEAELELLIATEREVQHTIDAVKDNTLNTLLYERYVNGKTWEQIAVLLNYSWRQTVRLHGVALAAVKDVIECHT